MSKDYIKIIEHYEKCLEKYGDTHRGVDWPKKEDVETRYSVMLDVMKREKSTNISLLDFGCGLSHLFDYIRKEEMDHIVYSGLEISKKFYDVSKEKHSTVKFYYVDVLNTEEAKTLPEFDFIILNGVFTEKCELTNMEMMLYFKKVVKVVFAKCKIGIAFNVMSKHVDWEREDLFHLPFDELASFLIKEITRNFVIRNDYGLFEYTVYLYK